MDAATYTKLLAGAEAQYDGGFRTLVRSEEGRWGLTGDYVTLQEATGMARRQRRLHPDAFAVAKQGGVVTVYELVEDELVAYEPPPFTPLTAPRARPSALA